MTGMNFFLFENCRKNKHDQNTIKTVTRIGFPDYVKLSFDNFRSTSQYSNVIVFLQIGGNLFQNCQREWRCSKGE